MNQIQLPRLTSGDVVELILADHRTFEELLRTLRDSTADREAARHAFATLHVAHAEAEEHQVYPTLRTKDAIGEHEEDHGEEEHAEGHEALLDVLEAEDLEGADFDELVEKLAEVINHHLTEEELTILNPAREEVEAEVLHRLGADFAQERNRLIDEGCGEIENVRAIVAEAQDKGLLDD
ncbi:MAG TPA: hemerythrin domain-containing protein [Marmoricola sp.]|nr:hemerythrin domain-containing protein [Marmoricola sp.]